jgi:hypothetical protein
MAVVHRGSKPIGCYNLHEPGLGRRLTDEGVAARSGSGEAVAVGSGPSIHHGSSEQFLLVTSIHSYLLWIFHQYSTTISL